MERWSRNLKIAALALLCLWLYLAHVHGALGSWFLREDSRFFSSGLFSFYDLWRTFATPVNSMGQYRPITKLLWGIPNWLWGLDPAVYHGISIALVAAAAALLGRLQYLLFKNIPLAVLTACFYALLPVHQKPIYWISAWHNTAAAVFFSASLVCRIEYWRARKRRAFLRALSLLGFFLAIASREVAFGLPALLLLTDREEGKSFRRSWDFLLLAAFMGWLLFLMDPPFKKAGVHLDWSIFGHPGELANAVWNFAYKSLWTLDEGQTALEGRIPVLVTALALALPVIGLVFSRRFLFPLLLVALGSAPYLLIVDRFELEYCSVMAMGLVLGGSAMLAFVRERFPWRRGEAGLTAAALLALFLYFQSQSPTRQSFRNAYTGLSLELEDFLYGLKEFSRAQPPYTRIHIVEIDPDKRYSLSMTLHFLNNGLNEFIPERVFLVDEKTLETIEGTGEKKPTHSVWAVLLPKLDPPLQAVYRGGRFFRK